MNNNWNENFFNLDYYNFFMKRDDSQLTHDCNLILQLSNIPSGKIADFCCGSGQMIKYFNNLKYDCYGVDFSKEYVDIAVNQFNLNNVFQGDALYFNFNSSFDLVINWNSSFGYFNEEKNELLLINMYNQLNKNGKIILEIFNSYYILLNFNFLIYFNLVPRAGIEPARLLERGILSPLCLPISPPRLYFCR